MIHDAKTIFAKFGGPARLHEAIMLASELDPSVKPRSRTQVYRWGWPESRGGTGGVVPRHAWPLVLAAARVAGVNLED